MSKRTTLILVLGFFAGVVIANVLRPRTLAEKVTDSELIVYGVATLEGSPVEKTDHPVERYCRIAVLRTLWPTNQTPAKTIVVRRDAWSGWPESWWKYSTRTGVYFLVSRATFRKELRAEMAKSRPSGRLKFLDTVLGTNAWVALGGFEDWYETGTNIAAVEKQIKVSRSDANPQGGANGRQPFSSGTNQASAAAASRR